MNAHERALKHANSIWQAHKRREIAERRLRVVSAVAVVLFVALIVRGFWT